MANGWYLRGAAALTSASAGSAADGAAEQAMTASQSGSVQVAFVSTNSLVAQHAFSAAIGMAVAAFIMLVFAVLVNLVEMVLKRQRGEISPSGQG
jgi:hypothetical protein